MPVRANRLLNVNPVPRTLPASSPSDPMAAAEQNFETLDAWLMTRAPTANDDGANTSGIGAVSVGQEWIVTTGPAVYKCASNATGAAVWLKLYPAVVAGAVIYQGTWNANTNTPALASGAGTNGFYYLVSNAGATTLDGIDSWDVGDWAVFNGTAWEKVSGNDGAGIPQGGPLTAQLDCGGQGFSNAGHFNGYGGIALWEPNPFIQFDHGFFLQYDSGDGKLVVFASDQTTRLFSIDTSGNVIAAGTITQNSSP